MSCLVTEGELLGFSICSIVVLTFSRPEPNLSGGEDICTNLSHIAPPLTVIRSIFNV